MKTILLAVATLGCSILAAIAGEAEGTIEAVDEKAHVIQLSDGIEYQLPNTLDMSLIGVGMKVALAFDEVEGDRRVTDMHQVN